MNYMTYYDDGHICIRGLTEEDISIIHNEEMAQGNHRTQEDFITRLIDQEEGKAIALAADFEGNVAGYGNVYLYAPDGSDEPVLCEIMDVGVFPQYRGKGVGSALMDVLEHLISRYSDTAYLSVGLHSGYGSAQRMYAKRGYLPDGSGAWYGDKPCVSYESYKLDDNLVLKMAKKLTT